MIQVILRGLIGLGGVLLLFIASQYWMDPTGPAAQLGVTAQNLLGTATLRADLGAFFATTGIFCLAAAILNRGRLMTAPILLFGLALAGRLLTVVLDGRFEGDTFPMTVEAVFLVVFLSGRFALGSDDR